MPSRRFAPRRLLLVGNACAVPFCILALFLMAYSPDDAFISFSYAKHFAAGHGWVASVGAPPVEGFSNPLWVFALVPAGWAGLDLVLTAKGLGIVCGMVLVMATVVLADVSRSANGAVPAVAGIMLGTWPPLALWAASGMENALYGMCLVLGALGVVREVWGQRATARSAWWWAAAIWTRPEAFGLAAVAAVWRLTAWRAQRRLVVRWCLIVVLALGGLFAWRYWTFGEWLPNTYYAKRNNLLLGNGPGYLWRGAWQAGFAIPVLFAALAPLFRLAHHGHRLWHPVWFLAMLAGAHAVFVLQVGGDWMHQFRFLTPMAPFVAVLAADGMLAAVRVGGLRRRAGAAIPGLVLACAWIAAWPHAWREARTNRSVDIMSDAWQPYRDSLHTLADALGPGASLVVPELGYPSYATDLRILDPLGLASAHIAHLRYERVDRLLSDHWRPDAIKVHSLVREALHLDTNRWFRDEYMLLFGPPDWQTRAEAIDGWYVRRDGFERPLSVVSSTWARFDQTLELRQARIMPRHAQPGDTIRVELVWHRTGPCTRWRYQLWLRTPSGAPVPLSRTPLHGWRPIEEWPTDAAILDRIPIKLEATLPFGKYEIALGLLDPSSGAHASITTKANAETAGVVFPLGSIEILGEPVNEQLEAFLAEGIKLLPPDMAEHIQTLISPAGSPHLPPETLALLRRLAADQTRDRMQTAWHLVREAGPRPAWSFDEARRQIHLARAWQAAEWLSERDAFVEQALREARQADVAPIPHWSRIRLAGLAVYTKPDSLEAGRLHRRLWAERVAWERRARESAPADVSAIPNGATIQMDPAPPLDAITRVAFTYVRAREAAAVLQIGLFEPAGFRVASVPLPSVGAEGERRQVILEPFRAGEEVRLRVRVGDEDPAVFPVQNLAPNPWGAPFYPAQPALLVALAVVEAGDAPRPLEILDIDVALRAAADRSAGADEAATWRLSDEPDRFPSLTELRDYERVEPIASSGR